MGGTSQAYALFATFPALALPKDAEKPYSVRKLGAKEGVGEIYLEFPASYLGERGLSLNSVLPALEGFSLGEEFEDALIYSRIGIGKVRVSRKGPYYDDLLYAKLGIGYFPMGQFSDRKALQVLEKGADSLFSLIESIGSPKNLAVETEKYQNLI